MKKNSILKIYKEKLDLYQKYNEFYYDKNESLVSDQVFDSLKKEILILEKKKHIFKK